MSDGEYAPSELALEIDKTLNGEVMKGVDIALKEQETFMREGRGDDPSMNRYDGRAGVGTSR